MGLWDWDLEGAGRSRTLGFKDYGIGIGVMGWEFWDGVLGSELGLEFWEREQD